MTDGAKLLSIYDPATGRFLGKVFSGSADVLTAKCALRGVLGVEGRHDHLSKRVDLATGEVVDWIPPAPPDTDLETFEWDALSEPEHPRWISKPTAKAAKQAKQALVQERMDKLEAKQARPLRELLLDPNDAQARTKLADLEAQLAELRIEFANPP